MQKKNDKGFSLVELIIVIAILAVLTGILAPAYVRYVDKAKRTAAIVECRECVQAAQTLLIERGIAGAGRSVGIEIFDTEYFKPPYDDILAIANVKGQILEVRVDSLGQKIVYMRYLSSKGLIVIYENGEYRIEDEDGGGNTEDTDESDDDQGGFTGGITATDSAGKKYKLKPTDPDAFEKVKAALKEKGEYTFTSGLYQDETGMYYVFNGPYFRPGAGTDPSKVTLADISAKQPNKWIKLNDDARMLTEADSMENGQKWPPVNKGDVCYYGGKYYIAMADRTGYFWEQPTSNGGTWHRLEVTEVE